MTLHCGKSNIALHSKTIFFHPAVNYVFRKGSYFTKRIYTSVYIKYLFIFQKLSISRVYLKYREISGKSYQTRGKFFVLMPLRGTIAS